MKRLLNVLSIIFLLFFTLSSIALGDTNVALNKNVALNGTFFTGGWGSGMVVGPETVTDGIFFPRSTQWDQGAVWWDSTQERGQNIEIDLNGTFSISSFIVQADDNDAYDLYYRNGNADPWHIAWNIPAVGGWGMQTRPNPLNDAGQYFLGSPITATDLMIKGNPNSDLLYSVSEIQAFGTPVPEPATMLLLGSGLVGLAGYGRKKFFKK